MAIRSSVGVVMRSAVVVDTRLEVAVKSPKGNLISFYLWMSLF